MNVPRSSLHASLALVLLGAIANPLTGAGTDENLRTPPRRPPAPRHRPGEVIVAFETATTLADVERAVKVVGGVSARRSRYGGHYLVRLDNPDADVPAAVARFNAMKDVAYAEPNGIVRAFAPRVPANDRFFFRQWHMQMLDVERVWAIQTGNPSVVVAVVDTGVAYENFGPFRKAPDWGNTVFVRGFNVFTGTEHANDDNFHGTHVASTIAEGTNNGEGVVGMAFGCAIMPVKVLDATGEGSFFDVAEGVNYAFRDAPQKANVINLSLGGEVVSRTLGTAIDAAVQAGVVVVAAAGNDGFGELNYPASQDNVISVGAVDLRETRAEYSNFGPGLDIVAPGGDVDRDDNADGRPDGVLQQTFDPDTAASQGRYDDFGYFYISGTSEAAPHVAALAALLIAQGIRDPKAVEAAIEASAKDLGASGYDETYGWGLIRPVEALSGLGLNR